METHARINARTFAAGMLGINGFVITVDVEAPSSAHGAARCSGVALDPETEARVLSALRSCGHRQRAMAIGASAPVGPGCDLAIALAILVALEVIPAARLEGVLCWGLLDSEGRIRRAHGMLVAVDTARANGLARVIVPRADARAASRIWGIEVTAADTLASVVAHLRGEAPPDAWRPAQSEQPRGSGELDMADVRGLARPRMALEVALAGGHHLLLRGPTGVGKTMLARRAGWLLPDLGREEALEVSKIHGLTMPAAGDELISRPPVRMPHHTVSVAGLLGGGGGHPRPGEVSLAHAGVLFLDELPEFSLACVDGLRGPMSEGVATVAGSGAVVCYPAKIHLIASMAHCPCGYLGNPRRACTCSDAIVERFSSRIGSIASRFDVAVDVEPQTPEDLTSSVPAESSAAIRGRICKARARQAKRWADAPWRLNAEIPDAAVLQLEVTGESVAVLRGMLRTLDLDGRIANRIMRVARTVQDLGGSYGAITGDSIMTAGGLVPLR